MANQTLVDEIAAPVTINPAAANPAAASTHRRVVSGDDRAYTSGTSDPGWSMLAGAQHFATLMNDGFQAALRTAQEPGVLDKVGAGAIGLFVLACWLFTSPAGRSR